MEPNTLLASDEKLLAEDNNLKNEDEEAEAKLDNPDIFNCGICYGEYNLKETQVKFLEKCKHTFCIDCFQETFRALVED